MKKKKKPLTCLAEFFIDNIPDFFSNMFPFNAAFAHSTLAKIVTMYFDKTSSMPLSSLLVSLKSAPFHNFHNLFLQIINKPKDYLCKETFPNYTV